MFSHVMKKIVCPIRIANDLFLFKGVRIIHLVGDPIKQTISEWPSSKNPHFQNEGKCKTFHVKISFICMRINNHFHINGFALCLALKQRLYFYRVRIETEQGTLTKQSQRAEDTKKEKVERGEKQVSWRCRGVA